jgi:hypothetical protein
MVPETSVIFNQLTGLRGREDFIKFGVNTSLNLKFLGSLYIHYLPAKEKRFGRSPMAA